MVRKNIKVSICCHTYNHAPYIREAIEGFLMQETNFPFEIIIHDDASTDGTAEIVKEYADKYPELIVPILQKENQYSKGAPIFSMYVDTKVRGEYIAFCEGDDYWIETAKLQRQFDLMEKEKDCSFCFHSVRVKDERTKKYKIVFERSENYKYRNNKLFEFDFGVGSHTSTLFARKECLEKIPEWYTSSPVGDYALKLLLSSKGCAYYLDETMSVWRTNVKGSWNDRIKKSKEQNVDYTRRMIIMLEGFNKHSNYKYDKQVKQKQLEYEIKSVQFKNFSQRLKVLKTSDYKEVLREIPIKKLAILLFVLVLPRVYRLLVSIKGSIL